MFTRIRLAAAAAFVVLGALAAQASTPAQHWMTAKVHVLKGGQVQLEKSSGTWTVAKDTGYGENATLAKLDGKWIRALVVYESGSQVQVTGFLAKNVSAHSLKVQGATDDYSAIAWIKKHATVVVHGEVTAEEEEGGYLYYMVHVASGGQTMGDPHTGYVRADNIEIVTF